VETIMLKTWIPLFGLSLAKLMYVTAIVAPVGAIGSIGLAESAFAQTDGQWIDLLDPKNQKKGHRPIILGSPACVDTPRLVAAAARKRVCVGNGYWRVYDMEEWVCHDAKGKSVYYRRITGFQTTGQPCGEEDFHVTLEEGQVFNETWPSTKWSTEAKRSHPSPTPHQPATPIAPPPSTPSSEAPPRSNNFH
jgi:hypothetical protein